MANEKHSKNITQRGNVAKSSVSLTIATPARPKPGGGRNQREHTAATGPGVASTGFAEPDPVKPVRPSPRWRSPLRGGSAF